MKKAEQVKAHDERSLATTKGEAEFLLFGQKTFSKKLHYILSEQKLLFALHRSKILF
jgi:hypothetical protein